MATNVTAPADRPQQYWLDVARPIQPRPLRDRPAPARRAQSAEPCCSPQMELRMADPPPQAVVPAPAPGIDLGRIEAPSLPICDVPARNARPCFVAWLLGQTKSGGAIGELAKAARGDRLFPRQGSAETVRLRFGKVGADGDTYVALDDAERAYDRLTRLE